MFDFREWSDQFSSCAPGGAWGDASDRSRHEGLIPLTMVWPGLWRPEAVTVSFWIAVEEQRIRHPRKKELWVWKWRREVFMEFQDATKSVENTLIKLAFSFLFFDAAPWCVWPVIWILGGWICEFIITWRHGLLPRPSWVHTWWRLSLTALRQGSLVQMAFKQQDEHRFHIRVIVSCCFPY